MRIVVTGAKGMLGRTLMRQLARHDCTGVDIDDFNITHATDVRQAIDALRPDVVIHTAAMTAVDACEDRADDAFRVNAIGTANIASACHARGSRMIYISTDYVFSGKLDRPYHEWDEVKPQSIYGHSKLAGEDSTRTLCPNHLIVRIAWLYGAGGPSFVHTMARLSESANAQLKVVDDQMGNPTSTIAVAAHLERLIELPICGTIHLTCEGETTWYGLAKELFRLMGRCPDLEPCSTADFPRPAPRPANSRLEKRALRLHGLPPMPDWHDELARFVSTEWPSSLRATP